MKRANRLLLEVNLERDKGGLEHLYMPELFDSVLEVFELHRNDALGKKITDI